MLNHDSIQCLCNDENQTDWLFQIASRGASFNLDKRTKIAGRRPLSTLAYLFSSGLYWSWLGLNHGVHLRSFFLCQGPPTPPWIRSLVGTTNDLNNYTFYSNFTVVWILIAHFNLNIFSLTWNIRLIFSLD